MRSETLEEYRKFRRQQKKVRRMNRIMFDVEGDPKYLTEDELYDYFLKNRNTKKVTKFIY